MEYDTFERRQENSGSGVEHAPGSLYDRFQGMSDPRKAKGKRYSLVTLLVMIFLAKLCGQDTPVDFGLGKEPCRRVGE